MLQGVLCVNMLLLWLGLQRSTFEVESTMYESYEYCVSKQPNFYPYVLSTNATLEELQNVPMSQQINAGHSW